MSSGYGLGCFLADNVPHEFSPAIKSECFSSMSKLCFDPFCVVLDSLCCIRFGMEELDSDISGVVVNEGYVV